MSRDACRGEGQEVGGNKVIEQSLSYVGNQRMVNTGEGLRESW